MFPRLDPKVYPIADDRQFFLELLQETRVMLVQGTGFNWATPDHFRIVFLPHEDDLREAVGRIARFLEQLQETSLVMKAIQVGLLGIGTVGSGVFNVLKRNQEEIKRRAGRGIEITMVADLDTARAQAVVGDGVAGRERCARGHRQPRDRHRRRADRRLRHRQGSW